MFPSLLASLFCPNLSVKKEIVERSGGGGRRRGRIRFVKHK